MIAEVFPRNWPYTVYVIGQSLAAIWSSGSSQSPESSQDVQAIETTTRKRHKRDAHDPEDWSDRNQHSRLDRTCLSGQWASTTKVKLKRCLAHEENNWYEHYSQRLQVSMLPNLSRRLHSSLDVWESQPIMRPFLLTLYDVLPCALGTVVGYAVYTLSHLKFVCKFFKETVGKINPRRKKKATIILLKHQYWTFCFVIFHH